MCIPGEMLQNVIFKKTTSDCRTFSKALISIETQISEMKPKVAKGLY